MRLVSSGLLCFWFIIGACQSRQPDVQATSRSESASSAPQVSVLDLPMSRLIDSLKLLHGNFKSQLVLGSFNGDWTVPNAILARADSAVLPLLECMSRSDSTGVTWRGIPLTLGAVCYAMLRNLIIYEPPDPDARWPGFIRQPPISDSVLTAAQAAWRPVIQRRKYALS
jgi:hypothetical protein